MNQTFSINRFLQYLRFCLTYNLGLILMCVSFMALSTLDSLTGAHKYVVVLYGVGMLILNYLFTPATAKNVSNNFIVEFSIPASLLEKYVAKNLLMILTVLIPFGIHAVACAYGFNGITHYFADGFELGTIANGLFMVWLFSAFLGLVLWASKFILHDTFNAFEPRIFTTFILLFASLLFATYNSVSQYTVTKSAIFFAVAIALLIIDYFIYKKTDAL